MTDSKATTASATTLNAVVTQRIEVAPGLVILRVVPDTTFDFKPGQFAVLALPGSAKRCTLSDYEALSDQPDRLIKRAYSIASSSVSMQYLEFYVTLVHSGQLTPRLFALEPGDRLWVSPKASGLFTLDDVPPDRNIVFVSTGTGLAPYMSMLRSFPLWNDDRHCAVLHGARHSWDLGYRSELTMIERMSPRFSYLPLISRPEEEPVAWGGLAGHIQDVWNGGHVENAWGFAPTTGNTHVFLCGNPVMVDDMVSILALDGFEEHTRKSPGQVHVERYW